jgi:CHAT domain-containing protein
MNVQNENEREFALKVSVVHGDLRAAKYPVAVGHYEGDVIVNAEAALDKCLGGRLRQRFDLGGYPGPEGTVEIIRLAKGYRPRGAIVVGLGKVGRLTPERLRHVFKTAASRLAIAVSEAPEEVADAPYRSAGFSSVLVGTDGGASTGLTDSILAIVRGALDANRLLRQHGLWKRVRIDVIEFFELYENMAIQAAEVLEDLERRIADEREPDERVECVKTVVTELGGRFLRPSNPYSEGWWQRISVRRKAGAASDAAADLQFTVLTDRARLEQDTQTTQRALVNQLVTGATSQTDTPLDLSLALYELLVPINVQDRIRHEGNLVLMLDRAAAAYPFELLAQRTREGPVPLSISRCLIRQVETEYYRENPRMAMSDDVLVIGDPMSLWAELPGAQDEARAVASLVEAEKSQDGKGFQATLSVREGPQEIISKLFAKEYRVLHIAAHGHYDPDPMKSGAVIGDRAFLTAAEVAALPAVPELVFLNCCHLGRMSGEPRPAGTDPRLAATIAEGFIRAGVRAIVVAGWAVDDKAALFFAERFYSQMLNKVPFGEAVKEARVKTQKSHGHTNTWGAYQCYGNPDFRLQRETPQGAFRSRTPVARSVMLQALQDIAAASRGASSEMVKMLTTELGRLQKGCPVGWLDGELFAEFGRVASELGAFREAIDLYTQAVTAKRTRAPISAVEQLANILGREATGVFLKDPASGPVEARDLLGRAEAWLDWLDQQLTKTRERHALRGSLHKRWAMITGGAVRLDHLKKARKAYKAAADAAGSETYEQLNSIALEGLLKSSAYAKLLPRAQQCLDDARQPRAESDRDFWSAIAEADALLHVRWFDGTLSGSNALREVKAAYQQGLAAGPSIRELRSVRDHIVFLAAILRDEDQRLHAALTAALDEIARQLADDPES